MKVSLRIELSVADEIPQDASSLAYAEETAVATPASRDAAPARTVAILGSAQLDKIEMQPTGLTVLARFVCGAGYGSG